MRIFWRMLVAVAVGLIVTATGALPARAEAGVPITNYDVAVNLTPEGVAEVRIDLTLDFGARSGHGPYIALATAQDDGADPSMEYTFEYSDVQVSSPSGPRRTSRTAPTPAACRPSRSAARAPSTPRPRTTPSPTT